MIFFRMYTARNLAWGEVETFETKVITFSIHSEEKTLRSSINMQKTIQIINL